MGIRRNRKIQPRKRIGPARPRLGIRISRGLDVLRELPEGVLSETEQDILRRIQDVHTGAANGRLTEADYVNMKRIADKHNVRIV
ncbi:MAG: hypothetical protein JW744_03560 [Candidatus Diapherotrites archaeon]|uniref:Uncharacterized protein n=1 Tax=Candidatus Iainarchaeum sp. TaxID=3101447 RepID=A0A939C7C7_9ARCH|nr:hypothetical protein [Candidatus Diapherotrites archaeon]